MKPILLLGLACSLLLACDGGLPELRAERKAHSITVHFETMGEYPTSVGRIVLKDVRSGRTVWEVRRSSGTLQLWKIHLQVGENPRQPEGVTGGGTFRVVVPQAASGFFLEPDTEYSLTVWSRGERTSRAANFELAPSHEHRAEPRSS